MWLLMGWVGDVVDGMGMGVVMGVGDVVVDGVGRGCGW